MLYECLVTGTHKSGLFSSLRQIRELREKWAWWVGALGAFVLMMYGIIPTLQPVNFGRVYAAYGCVFVVMSMLWGWWIDGQRRDRWDILGSLLCVVGVIIIMYVPRGSASPA